MVVGQRQAEGQVETRQAGVPANHGGGAGREVCN